MNELTIPLKNNSKTPLYEQIYQYIKLNIQSGHLSYGEKLPSTRALSKHLTVSRSTVELAYEQLLSEGYIESEPCRGFFVAQIEELYHLNKEKEVPHCLLYTSCIRGMRESSGVLWKSLWWQHSLAISCSLIISGICFPEIREGWRCLMFLLSLIHI